MGGKESGNLGRHVRIAGGLPEVYIQGVSEDTILESSPTGKRLQTLRKDDCLSILLCGKRIPLIGRIVLGRDRSCGVVLEHALVSKRHAMIQKIKDDYFITDLSSTNGTFVNGRAVPPGKYVRIEPGDKIKIGKTVLTLK